ncbi:MAG: MxaS protein, partial [Betaproteobacteria bacterium]
MSAAHEFHYRLPDRIGGHRVGSHAGRSLGPGQAFVSHASLYDRPDPRRLDLRASLRNVRGDWLVRVYRQRAGIPVHVVVDVSSSMSFGARRPKLHVVADFVEALGRSAFRVGDALGMLGFDAKLRSDLLVPARLSRGMGNMMASMLQQCETAASGIEGLTQAALQLAGREGLVFVVSDFHWPLERLGAILDLLARSHIVPMIVWDPAEIEPPAHDALVPLHDAESGVRRTLWMRAKLRARWREEVARRRAALDGFFAARGVRPFYVTGAF